jgi:glycosyltransferase involved in cell wall biosynthesis
VALPLVSIIIPCRNEKNYIRGALDSLLSQTGLENGVEILVADGLSDDGTSEILMHYEETHPEVKVLKNEDKTVPFALKILLESAHGDYILRADAHCVYPKNYVATLVNHLKTTDADNVGGIWDTVPGNDTLQARIIAGSLRSKFGVASSYRTLSGNSPVEVETVPFGAWRADHFNKYGPFDEKFLRAQDLEHNVRVKKMGGKIVCLPWLRVTYYSRETFVKFRRMAFQYGYWKIPVKKKHKVIFSVRQYFPPLLVLGILCSVPLGFGISPFFFLAPLSYVVVNFIASVLSARRDGNLPNFYLYMYAFGLFHIFYGLGYLRGYWDVYVAKKFGFTDITR